MENPSPELETTRDPKSLKPPIPMVETGGRVSPEAETLVEMDDQMECRSLFAVGDFVWGKSGTEQWWPGIVFDPARAPEQVQGRIPDAVLVAYFGGDSFAWCQPPQLKPFKSEFPEMAAQSSSKSFVSAVENALEEIGRCVELQMSCSCVVDEVSKQESRRLSFSNYAPIEFLQLVCDAAKDGLTVNMLEITMLRSWALAFGRGVGQQRRQVVDLVDNIDLDAPPGELIVEGDGGGECLIHQVEVVTMLDVSEENNQRRKRSMTKLIAEMDLNAVEVSDDEEEAEKEREAVAVVNEEKKHEDVKGSEMVNPTVAVDEGTGSGKRERKKSKYLSYPYTHFSEHSKNAVSQEDSELKTLKKRSDASRGVLVGSPRKPRSSGDGFEMEEDQKSLVLKLDATSMSEILSEFRATAVDSLHLKWNRLAKTVRGFFAVYRHSVFFEGSEFQAYQKQLGECDCMNGKGLDDAKVDLLKEGNSERSDKQGKGEVNGENLDDDKTKIPDNSNALQQRKAGKNNASGDTTLLDSAPSLTLLKRKMRIDGGAPVNVPVEIVNCLEEVKSVGRRRKRKNDSNVQASVDSGPRLCTAAELGEALLKPNGSTVLANGGSLVNVDQTVVGPPKGGKSGQKRRKSKEGISGDSEHGKSGKKRKKTKDGNSYASPAALLLSFAPGTTLPSKGDLISEFSKYGSLNEAGTEVNEDSGSARVVFTNSSDVEKALNSQDKTGAFAPPNVSYRVHYPPGNLSPSQLAVSVPKPLPYIRKNLERMISALTGSSVPDKHAGQADGLKPDAKENLVGEMQGLLEKVNQLLDEPPTGTSS